MGATTRLRLLVNHNQYCAGAKRRSETSPAASAGSTPRAKTLRTTPNLIVSLRQRFSLLLVRGGNPNRGAPFALGNPFVVSRDL